MTNKKKPKLARLISRYKKAILVWLTAAFFFIVCSLLIYATEPLDNSFNKIVADLLMSLGQTIIGAGLIGGGIGGVINFIFEEFKREEEEAKERLKEILENREKRKVFRTKMQSRLQKVHDDVELARVLIKSHRSGKSYGEQIRSHIMPSLVALKDFKRRLNHNEDRQLENNLEILHVSLTYMIAYLSALMEEFEANYLNISNLQNYQDALANRMRTLFTEIAEGKKEGQVSQEKKIDFLGRAEKLFENTDIPTNIEVVWQAMEELGYLSDFISEYRNETGAKSMFYEFFLEHYYHCNKIIRTKDSKTNPKLTSKQVFINNVAELQRIEEKKNSENPVTNKDSLTRKIMEDELRFDFESRKLKPL